MIRPIACVLGGMLFAGTAVADQLPTPPLPPQLVSGSYLICVGRNACSQAIDEPCSVALGDNTEFPPHASHVLVTPKGIWSLQKLDDRIVGMINREAVAYGKGVRPLERWYIDQWNDVCSGMTGVPIS